MDFIILCPLFFLPRLSHPPLLRAVAQLPDPAVEHALFLPHYSSPQQPLPSCLQILNGTENMAPWISGRDTVSVSDLGSGLHFSQLLLPTLCLSAPPAYPILFLCVLSSLLSLPVPPIRFISPSTHPSPSIPEVSSAVSVLFAFF